MTQTISVTDYLERIGTKPNSRRAVELIWIRATAARVRIACEKMTAPALGMLRDSVECAASLPTRSGWERKAVAHAEIFRLLAEIAGDPAAGNLGGGAGFVAELLRAVGPAADGMIISSRRRLLEHLAAGDSGAAEREMETHLRALHYMWRLTWASRTA
jgi:GntR family transcriptional regulator, transcriptional repressor for pyruvate dehydrogenase complex